MKDGDNDFGQQFASLKTTVDGLAKTVDGLVGELHGLKRAVAEHGRTPWGLVATFSGVGMMLVGSLWGLGIAPINQRIEAAIVQADQKLAGITSSVNRNTDRVQILELSDARKTRDLAEIETQFHGKYDASNLIAQFQFQMANLTRREAGLIPFDPPTFYPSTPRGMR